MKIRAILTDLDGTVLEPDGRARPEVIAAIAGLRDARVPVFPISSKTPSELAAILPALGLAAPAGFENGAGVLRADGELACHPAAVAVVVLRGVLDDLRRATGLPLRSIEDLGDAELSALVGLSPVDLARVRRRCATLPLVVEPAHDEELRRALPSVPSLRLVRGNRFLHLQGAHDKADGVPALLEALNGREGVVVACGDAANDAGLLAAADRAVIIPSERGADPTLLARCPEAFVAPFPHGRGWAASMEELLGGAFRSTTDA